MSLNLKNLALLPQVTLIKNIPKNASQTHYENSCNLVDEWTKKQLKNLKCDLYFQTGKPTKFRMHVTNTQNNQFCVSRVG